MPALQHFNYASSLLFPALLCLGSRLIKILIILLLISSPSFVSFHHMAAFHGQINVIELIKPITLIIQSALIGSELCSSSSRLTFLHGAWRWGVTFLAEGRRRRRWRWCSASSTTQQLCSGAQGRRVRTHHGHGTHHTHCLNSSLQSRPAKVEMTVCGAAACRLVTTPTCIHRRGFRNDAASVGGDSR